MEQENKDARRGAALAIADAGGFDRLRKQLADPRDSPAAAVAFLATVCKDHGRVEVAAELLQWAADDVPSSASYALNLLHAREILNDYEGALKTGERFFARGTAFHGMVTSWPSWKEGVHMDRPRSAPLPMMSSSNGWPPRATPTLLCEARPRRNLRR